MKYAFEEKQGMAKAYGKSLGISTKVSIEIAGYLRGKSTKKAKQILNSVLKLEHAIPFKRFTDGVGHKKGIASGRYPQKASQEFLKLVKQVEANAQEKGLSDSLTIAHICAHRASEPSRQGRQRSRKFKRTHVEIAVTEAKK
jgi:large subunit ribosomal protein L22